MRNKSGYLVLVLFLSVVRSAGVDAQTCLVEGSVSVSGTPVQYASITFVDNTDTTKKFIAITDTAGYYRVSVVVTSVEADGGLPAGFELEQNYPNPFSTSTLIPYKLDKQADVKVTIFDILGRKIKAFGVPGQAPGSYHFVWDGRNNLGKIVAPGVYLYRLEAKGETKARKMLFGIGASHFRVSMPSAIPVRLSGEGKKSIAAVQQKSFTVRIQNTDTTSPAIIPEGFSSVLVGGDTTLNFEVSIPSKAIVYLDSARQIIRGFGGVNMPGWTDVGDLTTDQVHTAFGTGEGEIGMTILRIRVPYDSTQFHLEVPTAALAESLGAVVMASPWSPPPHMKSNDTIVGGILRTDSYAAFAGYLKSFADYMAGNGAPLYAISVQNEPDVHVGYESCDYDTTQMLNFVKNNAPAVGTRIIAPESYKFDHAMSDPILNDSIACANLSIVGGHLYAEGALKSYPLAISKGKEIWMTEHIVVCIGWPGGFDVAQEINDCMNAGMSAYLLWYIRRGYGPIDEEGNVTRGGYAMAQYSRFVRPGFHRVSTVIDPPRSGLQMTAYRSGSRVVIVVLNKNSSTEQTFTIRNGTATSFTPYVTSGSKNCEQRAAITVSNGEFTATLDEMSVTTFISN